MNLESATARVAKRKDRFVVGYIGTGNCVYGKTIEVNASTNLIDTLTRKQAERMLSAMPCRNCAVFELVPVAVNHPFKS